MLVHIRCATTKQSGKARQYLAFFALCVATVLLCVWAYPQVRRGPLLVAASERLLAQGKESEALAALREALRLGGVPIGGAGAMLKASLKAGEASISRDLAQLLMGKGRPLASGLVGRAAGLLDASGDASGALELLDKRRDMGPLDTPEALHLGDLLRRRGSYEEALALYGEVLKKEPGNTAAGADRAETFIWMGRHAEAEKAAQELLARTPTSRAARLVLARAKAAGGNTEGAIAEYRKILGENP
jgi:tetratricopeptide (TPR) repeat protein